MDDFNQLSQSTALPLCADISDAVAVDGNDDPMTGLMSYGPMSIVDASATMPTFTEGDPELVVRRVVYLLEDKLLLNYQCALCQRVAYAPRQTHCLKRVCSPCIKPYFQHQSTIENCPLTDDAHKDLDKSELDAHPNGFCLDADFSRDHIARTILSKQKCYCYNAGAGCDWKDPQRFLSEHIGKQCQFEDESCCNRPCEFKCRRMDMERHNLVCQYVMVNCPDCGCEVTREGQDAHSDNDCILSSHLVCNAQDCGRSFKWRSEVLLHKRTNRECIDKAGSCGFNRFGCAESFDDVKEFKEHITDYVDSHLEMVVLYYDAQMKKIADGADVFDVNIRIRRLETLAATLFQQVTYTSGILKDMDRSQETLQEMTRILNQLIEDAEAQKNLQVKLQRRGDEKLDTIGTRIENLKRFHAEVNSMLMNGSEAGAVSLPASLTSMALTPSENLPLTNGELHWVIPDYKTNLERARNNEQASFYSPHFFTSPHGYRMRARVYLNGDGLQKGKRMSIFFLISKGQHDHTLDWPFSRRITFAVIKPDSAGEIGEKPRTFLPDGGVAFQKPKSDNNPATGCPDFLDLKLVQEKFISRNDQLTLFVGVETSIAKDSWYSKITNYSNRF